MTTLNPHSDLVLRYVAADSSGNSFGLQSYTFALTLRCGLSGQFRACHDASTDSWHNCRAVADCDDTIEIIIPANSLPCGKLSAELHFILPDASFPGGSRRVCDRQDLPITLDLNAHPDVTSALIEAAIPVATVTAYAIAKSNGYTGTQEEYCAALKAMPELSGRVGAIEVTTNEHGERIEEIAEQIDTHGEQINEHTAALAVHEQKIKSNVMAIAEVFPALEQYMAYGVEWSEYGSENCIRVGSMEKHRTCPIQSKMRVVAMDDDGNVTAEFPFSSLKYNGYAGGNKGQIMVEVPAHYRKVEIDYISGRGNVTRVMLSEIHLKGYFKVPKFYVGAFPATIQHSTQKLCSVVNTDPEYRGGDNTHSDWDGTYRSQLGRPATNYTRAQFREFARNRKPGSAEWNILTYDAYRTLYWLFVVEFGNLNAQVPLNFEPDQLNHIQGGIGEGATTFPADKMADTFQFWPIIPCGSSNVYDEGRNENSYTIPSDCSKIDGVPNSIMVNNWRGIENPFGNIAQILDGLVFKFIRATVGGMGSTSAHWQPYRVTDPKKFNDSLVDAVRIGQYNAGSNFAYQCKVYAGNNGSKIRGLSHFCDPDIHLIPYGSGPSFGDTLYTPADDSDGEYCAAWMGGNVCSGEDAGMLCMELASVDAKSPLAGTRLCFIPAEDSETSNNE